MRDGAVVSDERVRGTGRPLRAEPEEAPGDLHAPGEGAVIADHLRQALRAILTHPMRSALSMLGILIGVAAVIAMLALGGGARESIRQRLASMGSNPPGGAGSHRRGRWRRGRLRDPPQLQGSGGYRAPPRHTPHLPVGHRACAGRLREQELEHAGRGDGVEYEGIRAAFPTAGRFFTEDDVRGRRKVAPVGATVARELFGDSSPVGSIIKLNRVNFQVIGLCRRRGRWALATRTTRSSCRSRRRCTASSEGLPRLALCRGRRGVPDARRRGRDQGAHRQESPAEQGERGLVRDQNMAEMQEALESTTKTMTWLLGSIAAISSSSAASDHEHHARLRHRTDARDRPRGRRSARYADIMYQFLIESVVMTVSGGGGVALGIGADARSRCSPGGRSRSPRYRSPWRPSSRSLSALSSASGPRAGLP